MPNEKLRPSFTLDEDRVNELRKLIPEAFADNQINWETLKETLGEYLEEEDYDAEHFGLFWPGKREARKIASTPSKGTLVPAPGEGINEDETGNIFIEGENLEVLKLLQKSYAGKIKMIYIDPPYNTGNDFIYDDDFKEPIDEYLRRTGQVDEEGKPLTTNKKADGRFHSKWLSMMYPRLKLAKNLLTEDGFIFISIDDSEYQNLKIICDEIFGAENFIGTVVRRRRKSQANLAQNISTIHEYLFIHSKSTSSALNRVKGTLDESAYKNPDDDPRGPYVTMPCTNKGGAKYSIKTPAGNIIEEEWRFKKETYARLEKEKKLIFPRGGKGKPRYKIFLEEKKKIGVIPNTWWDNVSSNQEASEQLKQLFNGKQIFNYPKPVDLIKLCIQLSTSKGDIVLDFFSGSCTTAHAIIELNNIENVHRRFIMIQIPELLDENSIASNEGYNNLAEIGKERIRRVIKKIQEDDGIEEEIKNKLGFKVFKLQKSNYKEWDDYDGTDVRQLEAALGDHESPLVDGWKEENLLTEILLMEGFPLDSKIAEVEQYNKNKINNLSSDFCDHQLWVCLDDKVEKETIDKLEIGENDIFVCLDSAITDQNKARLMDKGILKTI